MAQKKKTDNTKKLTFEQAITQLTQIVTAIESRQTSLADSLGQYEKGMALIAHCRSILTDAEKKIDSITASKPDESTDQTDDDSAETEDQTDDDEEASDDESSELF
jgi:exodeoxyribonuclease VII small subunit